MIIRTSGHYTRRVTEPAPPNDCGASAGSSSRPLTPSTLSAGSGPGSAPRSPRPRGPGRRAGGGRRRGQRPWVWGPGQPEDVPTPTLLGTTNRATVNDAGRQFPQRFNGGAGQATLGRTSTPFWLTIWCLFQESIHTCAHIYSGETPNATRSPRGRLCFVQGRSALALKFQTPVGETKARTRLGRVQMASSRLCGPYHS